MNHDAPDDARIELNRRHLMLGLAFSATAGLAAWRKPQIIEDRLGDRKLENIIPKKVGDWSFQTASGLVIPPEDQLSRALYSQLLTRVYADGQNSQAMLLVAQSSKQTGVLQIHRPETCYPAGGYALSPLAQQEFSTGEGRFRANVLTATNDYGSEHIVYWTRIGKHMPLSWADQRWSVARDNLQRIIPDALLARISVVHEDRGEALRIIESFIRSLLISLPAQSRQILIA